MPTHDEILAKQIELLKRDRKRIEIDARHKTNEINLHIANLESRRQQMDATQNAEQEL